MTEREAPSPEFIAAYMAACANRPADWNEIGYWYARQCWDASRKQALEEAAETAEMEATGDPRDAYYDSATRLCAAAIRSLTSPIGDKA